MSNDELRFADDRPITLQQDDLLDRAGFAQRLALAINSWKNRESLVIGLTGGWGSGKSSIKNMAVEQLTATKGAQVIEFNPWQWSAQDNLSSAFFAEVSRIVQRKDSSDSNKQLAKQLRTYSRRLNTSASWADGTAKILPIVLGSTLVTSLLGTLVQGTVAQITWLSLTAVSALGSLTLLLKRSSSWLGNWAKNLDEDARDSAQTLGQIRTDLQALLSARQQPLLIVLDDLDRLSAEQMKAIFQLVKAHMDFANVVFLLLFQRDTVEQGLDKVGFEGAAYLDKIIQVPFNVPAIGSGRLESILFKRLDAILDDEPQLQERFDQEYWAQMYQAGMRPFFRNLRHVYRYASTLAFHCRLLRGTEVAEVNPVDLFAVECLRIFAPATYATLPHHKGLLTSSEPFSKQDEAQRARVSHVIEELTRLAPAEQQPATRQLLQEMFPTLDWVFTNTYYDRTSELRWLAQSRVCCDKVFDRYFELSLPDQDLPNSVLYGLSRSLPEPEAFTRLLVSHESERQGEILQRMLGLVEEFPLDQSLAVVQSLLRAGEAAGREMSYTNWSPRLQVARLLRLFLERHALETTRSQLVIEAFATEPGLVVVHQLLAGDAALRRKGDVGNFDDAGFEQLKERYLATLLQVADRDPDAFLASEDHASYLIDLNRYSTDGDAGRSWVETHVNSPSRFLSFARGQVNSRTRYFGNGVSRTELIVASELAQLMGLALCTQWAQQLEGMTLNELDVQTLDLVKAALDQRTQEAASG
ncbi:KAP family P-loop NTPase fold protein [Pseudomonas putida]|uniref:AAA family ATPase n=1 Tax=Pseudomonas putida TaxID=303 RepID=A0A8I1JKI3_PSEPU|nr:P-loop NTPase fold protein [Pseudomonas putida]MBI6883480.1 AAA family ATPase [Pseudomonas putida]